MTTRTLAVATGELLRSRPATNMPGYVALEVVRPCQRTELWHVVLPQAVDGLVQEWALERRIDLRSTVPPHMQELFDNMPDPIKGVFGL